MPAMDRGHVPKFQPELYPPRTTWKSNSHRGSDRTVVGHQTVIRFSVSGTTPRCYALSKRSQAGSTNRLDRPRAGCHESSFFRAAGRRGIVSLDSPFHRTRAEARDYMLDLRIYSYLHTPRLQNN
jgi:hypothetical protein